MAIIIVSGSVGSGKSTVCERVVLLAKSFGFTCGGVVTRKTSDGGLLVVDLKTGRTRRLASAQPVEGGTMIGRYYFHPEGVEFGLRAIEDGNECDLLMVDEIGYLELGGGGFARALNYCVPSRHSMIVIRSNLLAAYTPYLGPGLMIFETTPGNRDELPARICACLPGRLLPAGSR